MAAGFDAGQPAVVASTGGSVYLTEDAIAGMLRQVAVPAPLFECELLKAGVASAPRRGHLSSFEELEQCLLEKRTCYGRRTSQFTRRPQVSH
jgi:O-methyltransferase involved in polyketide biosynthesis